MRQLIKRRIGQILLNGSFMSNRELDHALEEQKHTKELLGQVLVRMGIVKERDFKVPLIVQQHLSNIDDAVKIAAGERQLLGVLLVSSGHITKEQLDHAIAEKERSGDRLGEVFIRLGMLTEKQLTGLLDFQKNQSNTTSGPLRLGELLVATGHISRSQLDNALRKQSLSHKKIGEVLVEEGYVRPSLVKYGICMQKMLLGSVLAGIMALGTGGTSFASSVVLQWDPSTDADLAGYRLYSSPGASALESTTPVDVQNLTEATVSGLDPAQSYKFAVTAYDSSGVESSFSNIVSLAEQAPPSVVITSPADSISVNGTVTISVDASDNVGIAKVEFYVNGELKSTDVGAPYVYSWDTTSLVPGIYTLTAKAYDIAGNIGQSASSVVTVVNDAIPPTVVVTSPVSNAVVSGDVTINSSASDNVAVSKVEFYINGVFIFASNTPPYSYIWDSRGVANGDYIIIAQAYDNAGNFNQSSSVSVKVNNIVADLTAPTLNSFAMPASSTSLTVPVSAFTASDNIGVTGYMITESTAKPAAGSVSWSSSPPVAFTFSSPGAKTAYAWAKDAAGNVSTSRSVPVTITLPDTAAPVVTISNLVASSTVSGTVAIKAAATDDTGVSKVEYYVNGLLSATVTASPYTFNWNTASLSDGPYTVTAKAYDASGNIGQSAAVTVTVYNAAVSTAGSVWPDSTVPGVVDSGPDTPVELGVKFRSDTPGYINGVRFYKAAANTGIHVGNLWDNSGRLLATATFTNETASGWQKVNFPNPVAIAANTVYVVSYHTNSGHYSDDLNFFAGKGVDNGSLHLLADGAAGPSGVFSYGSSSKFPNQGWKSSNYWVDVISSGSSSVTIPLPDVTAPTLNSFSLPSVSTSLTVPVNGLTASDNVAVTGYMITESSAKPAAGSAGWSSSAPVSFTFSSAGAKTAYAWARDAAGNVSNGRSASVTITLPVLDTTAPSVSLANLVANSTVGGTVAISATAADNVKLSKVELYVNGTLYATDTTAPYSFSWNTAAVANGPYTLTAKAYDTSGNVGQSATVTVNVNNAAATVLSAWSDATIPGIVDTGPDGAVELGVKFRSDVAGYITGIRFYKAAANTGTHIGNLWDKSGKLLATAKFTNETASGWQKVDFTAPVAIAANTVYVASYHTNVGHYSDDLNYFAGKGVDNGPLHLLADGVSGPSGVYMYGTTSKFPSLGWKSSNYWVDVLLKK